MRARTLPQVTWRDQNADGAVQPTELQGVPAAAATPSEGFKRSAFGTDARIHVLVPALGELVLRGELIVAKKLARATMVADPVAARRDLREVGWAVALTQDLTPWAMVGVRHDTFDPDTRALEQPATPGGNAIDAKVSTWAFLAMARYKKGRLVGEFAHRQNALGRDASGAPSTLADDSFTLRAAMGF